MWGIEHSAMIFTVAILTGWLLASRDWFALIALVASQAPFWIGFVAYSVTQSNPTQLNMVTDLAVSAFFVWLAYRFDQAWLIWISVVFLCAGLIDISATWFGVLSYVEIHELLHYSALVLIVGRGYIVRIDRHLHNLFFSVSD